MLMKYCNQILESFTLHSRTNGCAEDALRMQRLLLHVSQMTGRTKRRGL